MWRHIPIDSAQRDLFNRHRFVVKISSYSTKIPKKLQREIKD